MYHLPSIYMTVIYIPWNTVYFKMMQKCLCVNTFRFQAQIITKIFTYMNILGTLQICAGHDTVLHAGTVSDTAGAQYPWSLPLNAVSSSLCPLNATVSSSPVTTKKLPPRENSASHLKNHHPKGQESLPYFINLKTDSWKSE